MREPERLADNPASEVEARLLQVGRSYRASARTRARVLVAVGVAGASSSLAGTAAAKLLASKLGLFAAAGVAVSVAAGGYMLTRAGAPAPVVTLAARPAPAAPPAAAPVEEAAPPAPVRAVAPPPERAAPSQPAPANNAPRSAKPARAAKTSSPLQEELARLDAASSLLRSGAASEALAELDRYDRDFGSGKLRMESAVLRIEALARAGQTERARTLADAFLKRHSASVLATRVRRYATPP